MRCSPPNFCFRLPRYGYLTSLLFLALYAWSQTVGQETFEKPLEWGAPPTTVFDIDDFGSRTTVRALAWAESGVLYCGTDQGVVRFDGEHWTWIEGYREEDIISLTIGADEGIYFSTFSGLGVLRSKSDGGFEKEMFDFKKAKADGILGYAIWSGTTDDKTYFVTTTGIYVYHQLTGEMIFVDAKTSVGSPVLLGDKLYCVLSESDLAVLDNGNLELIGKPKADDEEVSVFSLTKVNEDTLRCFLSNSFIVDFKDGEFSTESMVLLSNQRLIDQGFITHRGNLITVEGGMIIEFDHEARFMRRLDVGLSGYGTKLEYVRFNPRGNELWASVGTRLIKLEIDSATTSFKGFHGISGAIVDIVRFRGELLVFTDRELLKGQYGQSKRLRRFNRVFDFRVESLKYLGVSSWGLWVEVNGALNLYDGERFVEGEELGGYQTNVPYEGPFRLFKRSGAGMLIYERVAGKWIREEDPVAVGSMIYWYERDADNSLWLELGPGAIGRIVENEEGYRVERYGTESGLTDEYIGISVVGEKCLFMTRNGLLEFDDSEKKFKQNKEYAFIHEVIEQPWRVWSDQQGRVWVRTERDVGFIRRDSEGRQIYDTSLFDRYREAPPELRWTDDDGTSWFDSSMGLVQCKAIEQNDFESKVSLKVSSAMTLKSGKILRDDFLGGVRNEGVIHKLDTNDNSLLVKLSSPLFGGDRGMKYQYRLHESEGWSPLREGSDIELIGLESGSYQFEARAETRSGEMLDSVGISFEIKEATDQTLWKWAAGFAGMAFLLGGGAFAYTYLLKSRNARLEETVGDRTREVEEQKESLTQALEELREIQSQLMESARLAGRAEVATSVLHNVGNVLNSIMVSINSVNYKIGQSKVVGLNKAVEMLDKNRDNLAEFLTNDVRGARMIDYLKNLNEVLISERDFCVGELEDTKAHVAHAGTIIANQQKHAKTVDVGERFALRDVVGVAARLGVPSRWLNSINTKIEVDEEIYLNLDQSVVLQMVTNFVKNSSESIMDARIKNGRIDITATVDGEQDFVFLKLSDNGGGIPKEKLGQVFSMGFTTKDYGHGFGMHAVANYAKSMGGNVSIDSDGIGHGATVTLKLPLSKDETILLGTDAFDS